MYVLVGDISPGGGPWGPGPCLVLLQILFLILLCVHPVSDDRKNSVNLQDPNK